MVKDSHDDVVLQFADNDERQNSTDTTNAQETTTTATTKPVSNTTNYSTTSSNKLSKDENVNATNDLSNDTTDNVVSSKSTHTNDNNKDTSKETNLNCEKDELVLDVLNDDLIEKVRVKISCKYFPTFFFFLKMSSISIFISPQKKSISDPRFFLSMLCSFLLLLPLSFFVLFSNSIKIYLDSFEILPIQNWHNFFYLIFFYIYFCFFLTFFFFITKNINDRIKKKLSLKTARTETYVNF